MNTSASPRPRARRARGMTMLEVIMALSVMVVLMMGFASMAGVSLTATRGAKPAMLAQEAAWRLAERMQAETVTMAITNYWSGATITTIGGVKYATSGGGLDDVLNGVSGEPGLLMYYKGGGVTGDDTSGLMGAPADGNPPLRVRFLNESEYQTMWNLATSDADLNFDGSLDTGDPQVSGWPDVPAYRILPVLISIHWTEGTASRRYELKTVISGRESMN